MKKTLIITLIPFFKVLTNSYVKEIKQVTPTIKGVGTVVKKNPGSGASKLTAPTDQNGESTVDITEIGNYSIVPVYPKSSGVDVAGEPIRAVKVGLGKSPAGAIKYAKQEEDGSFSFNGLAMGSYKIVVLSATENTCPAGFVNIDEVCTLAGKESASPVRGGLLANWGKYGWDGDCNQGGIFCRKWLRLPDLNAYKPEENSTSGESKIALEGNVITVTTIGTKGSIGDELLLTANEKSLKPMPGELPQEMLKDILGNVGLKMPSGKVRINPIDQKVVINDTENRGKKLRILEVYEKANLSIDGKTYSLHLITTSGRGGGSPKHAGF